MGITGLQTFYHNNCPHDCLAVDIIKLLNDFRKENDDVAKPTIVVDGTGCIRTLYGNLNWVCGGQFKEFRENVQNFVNSFEAINVKLVFFFDGPTVEEKRQRWVERRIQTMRDVDALLNDVKAFKNLRRHRSVLPPGLGNVTRFLFQTEFKCEVLVSIKECDEEIAEYARRNKCFAILAQDTDFLILEGARYYLSMNNLNLSKMTTTLYDRSVLAKALGLDEKYLPLFATLSGNDIVKISELDEFHSSLSGKGVHKNVASFINSLQIDDNNENIYDQISESVFHSKSKSSIIKYSVKSYKPTTYQDDKDVINELGYKDAEWNEIVGEALKRHRSGMTTSHVWAIIIGLPFELSAGIEDYSSNKRDLPFASGLYRPLRQKIYGLLLKEKACPEDQKEHLVKEWVMPDFVSTRCVSHVTPIFPTVPHPGLLALWGKKSKEVEDAKWNLFVRAVSDTINGDKLRKLETFLILPTVGIYYMLENGAITQTEAKAFIATAVVVNIKNVEWLKSLKERPPNERAVRLATLYARACGILTMLITAIGEPINIKSVMPWFSFDGKLFQMVYYNAVCKNIDDFFLCNRRQDLLTQFQSVAEIVFDN